MLWTSLSETDLFYDWENFFTVIASESMQIYHCVVPENIHTPHGEIFQFDPHPPGIEMLGGFMVLPSSPWNFHNFPAWVHLPLGNSICINNKTCQVI